MGMLPPKPWLAQAICLHIYIYIYIYIKPYYNTVSVIQTGCLVRLAEDVFVYMSSEHQAKKGAAPWRELIICLSDPLSVLFPHVLSFLP